jgi:stage II sporulation protein D
MSVSRLGNYWVMRTIARAAVLAVVGAVLVGSTALAAKEVKITGGGWGHGIGMSQYGAYGRALDGKSATEILEAYYTGANVRTADLPQRIRVGLLQGRGSISATSSAFTQGGGRVVFKAPGKGKIAEGGVGTNWRVESTDVGATRLYKNGHKVTKNGDASFGKPGSPLAMVYEPHNSLVSIKGKAHDYAYGRMLFDSYASCGSGYCLRLVLSLPTQKYLYGLGEVPASWPGAALRAQTIAGRTYVFSKIQRLGQHLSPCDCAVYDSTIDQAYIGDSKRTGSGAYWDEWKAAVDDTDDQVVVYNGEPIQAYYFSSSGGYTENNENVWGGTPIPYLRGVPDPADAVAANPNHSWTVKMSWSVFSNKLSNNFGTGAVNKFKLVPPFGVSGRVTVVKSSDHGGARVVGAQKTVRVDGADIRTALGLKDTLFRVKVITK